MRLIVILTILASFNLKALATEAPTLVNVEKQPKQPDRQFAFTLWWKNSKTTNSILFAELFRPAGFPTWTIKITRNLFGHGQERRHLEFDEGHSDEFIGQIVEGSLKWLKAQFPEQMVGVLAMDIRIANGLWVVFHNSVKMEMLNRTDNASMKSTWLKTTCERALARALMEKDFEKYLRPLNQRINTVSMWDYVPIENAYHGKPWAKVARMPGLGLLPPVLCAIELKAAKQ